MAVFKNNDFNQSNHAVMVGTFVNDEVILTISEKHNKRSCELRLTIEEWEAFRYYTDTSHPVPTSVLPGQNPVFVPATNSITPVSDAFLLKQSKSNGDFSAPGVTVVEMPSGFSTPPKDTRTLAEKIEDLKRGRA
jgi:hypothetical protein